ncbi:double zinc ribbon domain-containing protein [Halobacteriales archaeon Cl-PHB]
MSESTGSTVECPICGEAFDPTAAGGWCTNSKCGEYQYEGPIPGEDGKSEADGADGPTEDGFVSPGETGDENDPLADVAEQADEAGIAAEDDAGGDAFDLAEPDADDAAPLDEAEADDAEEDEVEADAVEPATEADEAPAAVEPEADPEPDAVPADDPAVDEPADDESVDDEAADVESVDDEAADEAGGDDAVEDDAAAEEQPAEVDCPGCGDTVSADLAFCPGCGEDLSDLPAEDDDAQAEAAAPTACPDCGADVEEDQAFCAQCGTDLSEAADEDAEPSLDECPGCGADVDDDQAFCAQCGEDLDAARAALGDEDDDAEVELPDSLVLSARGRDVEVSDGEAVGRQIRRLITETGGNEDEAVRVHREHFRIVRDDGQYYVVDLGDNPTVVNDRTLTKGDREPVGPGDEVELSGVVTLDVSAP